MAVTASNLGVTYINGSLLIFVFSVSFCFNIMGVADIEFELRFRLFGHTLTTPEFLSILFHEIFVMFFFAHTTGCLMAAAQRRCARRRAGGASRRAPTGGE